MDGKGIMVSYLSMVWCPRQKKILNLDIMLKLDKEKLWHHPHFDREIYQLEVEAID
jgi:hypothetical protein